MEIGCKFMRMKFYTPYGVIPNPSGIPVTAV